MDGWNKYLNKKVYVVLINDRKYSGKVINIDNTNHPLVWISLTDREGRLVTFLTSEIKLIQEEE